MNRANEVRGIIDKYAFYIGPYDSDRKSINAQQND